MNEVDSQEESLSLSQASYNPTPYEDSSWEIVGEPVETREFLPMEIELLPRTQKFVDPMFADYGGAESDQVKQRWHLPEEVAAQMRMTPETGEAESEEVRVSLTEAELMQLKQQAFEEGKQAGLEEAITQNADKITVVENKMQQIMSDLKNQIEQQGKAIENQAVEFIVQITDKLIPEAVDINPEYIVQILKEALTLSNTARIKSVRVNPQDLEFVQLVGLHKQLLGEDETWHFQPDPTIKMGCLIETSAGETDFQVDKAWERIREKVLKVR